MGVGTGARVVNHTSDGEGVWQGDFFDFGAILKENVESLDFS